MGFSYFGYPHLWKSLCKDADLSRNWPWLSGYPVARIQWKIVRQSLKHPAFGRCKWAEYLCTFIIYAYIVIHTHHPHVNDNQISTCILADQCVNLNFLHQVLVSWGWLKNLKNLWYHQYLWTARDFSGKIHSLGCLFTGEISVQVPHDWLHGSLPY